MSYILLAVPSYRSFACNVHSIDIREKSHVIRYTNPFAETTALSGIIVVKPMSHQRGVLTAFPQRTKNVDRRGFYYNQMNVNGTIIQVSLNCQN